MRVLTIKSNHHHNCTGNTCTHESHVHTKEHNHSHSSEHKHDHSHNHNKSLSNTFKKLLAPRNLLLAIATMGISQLFTYILSRTTNTAVYNQEHKHTDNILSFSYAKEILVFLAQFVFSMASWTVLNNIISSKFKLNKPTTWLNKINSNTFKKSSHELWDLKKFISIVSLSYVGIQALTDYGKSQISPENSKLSTLINTVSFIAKAVSIFVTDALLNKKPLSIIAFWQSLIDSCACCGNPKLFCPQIAPIFVDLYNQSTFGKGLTQVHQ